MARDLKNSEKRDQKFDLTANMNLTSLATMKSTMKLSNNENLATVKTFTAFQKEICMYYNVIKWQF